MRFFFRRLKPYGSACALGAVLLCAQAFFALASPAVLGRLVYVGVQKSGWEESFPRVMSRGAAGLLRELLPGEALRRFESLYTDTPGKEPEPPYRGSGGCLYLKENADEGEAGRLYGSAVWMAVLAARESGLPAGFDPDAAARDTSLTSLMIAAESVRFTEERRVSLYAEAEAAPAAVKEQAAAVLLPLIYEDAGLDGRAAGEAYVRKCAVALILCAAGQFLTAAGAHAAVSRVAAGVEKKLRADIVSAGLSFGLAEEGRFPGGRVARLRREGAAQFGMAVRYGFQLLVYAPVLALAGGVLTFRLGVPFGLMTVGGSLLAVGAAAVAYAAAKNRYYRMQEAYGAYDRRLTAILGSLFTVRGSSAEAHEAELLSGASERVTRDERFVLRAVLTALGAAGLAVNALIAAAAALGLDRMLASRLDLGGVLTAVQYAALVTSAFLMLGGTVLFAPRVAAALRETEELLTAVPAAERFAPNTEAPGRVETVEFRAVRLFADSLPFDLTLRRGSLTVLTGETGAGKTLLAEALRREFIPYSGEIRINGVPIGRFSPAYPGGTVAYVGGRGLLYTATVRQNLRLNGARGDDGALLAALGKAACGFLGEGSAALDRRIENGGAAQSGGERSRLALAACFAREAGVYVFDDCLSALDPATRGRILPHIAGLKRSAAVLLITQDDTPLPGADDRVILRGRQP